MKLKILSKIFLLILSLASQIAFPVNKESDGAIGAEIDRERQDGSHKIRSERTVEEISLTPQKGEPFYTLSMILEEILETEGNYLYKLNVGTSKISIGTAEKNITRTKLTSKTEKIYRKLSKQHEEFLKKLTALKSHPVPTQIQQTCEEMSRLIQDEEWKSLTLWIYSNMKVLRDHPQLKILNINNELITPQQRPTRYQLFLENILQHLSIEEKIESLQEELNLNQDKLAQTDKNDEIKQQRLESKIEKIRQKISLKEREIAHIGEQREVCEETIGLIREFLQEINEFIRESVHTEEKLMEELTELCPCSGRCGKNYSDLKNWCYVRMPDRCLQSLSEQESRFTKEVRKMLETEPNPQYWSKPDDYLVQPGTTGWWRHCDPENERQEEEEEEEEEEET